MKPYFEEAGIAIYHGDCREILPQLPPADLIFTSPPYNLGGEPWPHLGNWKPGDSHNGHRKWSVGPACSGIEYLSHDDAMPHEEYADWQRSCVRVFWEALAPNGAIFYNHKPRVIGGYLWTPLTDIAKGFPLRQIVIWARAGGINFNPTAYVPTHEWVMIFAHEGFRLRDKGASGVGDVWYVPQEANTEHPAPFPIGLPLRAMQTTKPGLVIDPFMGSGTTLRAAKDLGRQAIGIEIEEKYCEIAAKRLAQGVLDFAVPETAPDHSTEGTTSPEATNK